MDITQGGSEPGPDHMAGRKPKYRSVKTEVKENDLTGGRKKGAPEPPEGGVLPTERGETR